MKNIELSKMRIFKENSISKGYSSHGVFCSLSEVLELEQERGNATVDAISGFLKKYPSKKNSKAIWVVNDPFLCFKMYSLLADYYNCEDTILKKQFPNWYYDIHEINLSNMQMVCCDEQGGYLYCV